MPLHSFLEITMWRLQISFQTRFFFGSLSRRDFDYDTMTQVNPLRFTVILLIRG